MKNRVLTLLYRAVTATGQANWTEVERLMEQILLVLKERGE